MRYIIQFLAALVLFIFIASTICLVVPELRENTDRETWGVWCFFAGVTFYSLTSFLGSIWQLLMDIKERLNSIYLSSRP